MNSSAIADDASATQLTSIRNALLLRFVTPIVFTFLLFCVALYFMVLQPATTQIGRSEMQHAAEQAELQIASVVGQIERIALTGRDWGIQDQFSLSDQFSLAHISAFNRIFMPVLSNQSQVTSVLFADTRGREFLLLKMPNGEWLNRITDTQRTGKRQHLLKWRGTDELIEEVWTELEYDPLRRPWHIGAMSLKGERAVHWTDPYVFFTTKDLGITASTKWQNTVSGDDLILAFDVKLDDLSKMTTTLRVGENGKAAILTDDHRIIGIPRHPDMRTEQDIRNNLLRKPSETPFNFLASAMVQWEQAGRPYDRISEFRSGKENWLWRFHATPVGNKHFIVATLAPDSDFLPVALKQAAGVFVFILLAVLALGVLLTARMARGFSIPLQKLAQESRRLGELDLERPVVVEAPWHELAMLTSAQERMRIALKASTTALEQSNRDLETRVAQRTRELGEREAYFRAIFENTGVGILCRGPDARIIGVNDAYLDFVGYSREELEHIEPTDLMSAAERTSVSTSMAKLQSGELAEYRVERQYRRKDGQLRWADVVASAIRDPEGRFLATVSIVNDITRRKEADALLQAILDRIPLPVFYGGPGTEFLGCNLAYEIAFGIKREDYLGKPTIEQTFLPQQQRDAYQRENIEVIRDGSTTRKETQIPFADGQVHDIIYSISGFRKPDGTAGGLVGVLVDISELRRAQAALLQAKDAAEDATRAKSLFLANMSHEIRTPMNGVVGMLEILTHSALSEEQADAVRTMRESAFSLLGIIDDILDFSKMEAGRLELERTAVSVVDLVEDVCTALSPIATAKDVDLAVFVAPDVPPQIWGDSTRLRQVFNNLIGNAIKFSGDRSEIRGSVAVRVTLDANMPSHLTCAISDNGIGMTPETLQNLFTSFSQAQVSITRRFGGTGLGLAICRRLVDLMKGEIAVESMSGHGSTFTVTLPIEGVAGGESRPLPDLSGQECVVVSGPVVNSNDLRVYLEYAGARVHLADGLDAAAPLAAGLTPPVVVIHDAIQSGIALDTLRAAFAAASSVRHLLIVRGSRRQRARMDAAEVVTVDGNVLRRQTFLRAVAVAGGRATPDMSFERKRSELVAHPSELPSIADARAQDRLILVAEDDEINRKVITQQLALLGYAAEIAANGMEALQLWREADYALLLTDLSMPEMDGYQLTECIRREESANPRMPILALTANAMSGEIARASAVGMDEYLTKPLQLQVLKTILEKWLPPLQRSSSPARRPRLAEITTDQRVIDLSVLTGLVGDDPQIVREFLADFQASAQRLNLELRASVAAGDSQDIASITHRLKASSRCVGATTLGDVCAELENAGKIGDKAAIMQGMMRFESALLAVETQISGVLKL